jgi:hypothetical protein
LSSNAKIILKWTTHVTQLNYDRQQVLKCELDTVQTQFHAIQRSTLFKLQFTGNCTDAAAVALRPPNTTSKIVGSLDANFQIRYTSLLSSNAYTRRHQRVIGCGLPVTMVMNTLQNTARKNKERKKSISGFFAKKNPSINESIQSKVRSLEKLPAIVLSEGSMMQPKGAEK